MSYIIMALMCWPLISANSQNLRRLSTREGLSSSFLTCLNQTDEGLLWIGTLDDVNVFYGQTIDRPFQRKGHFTLSCMVERIIGKDGRVMWIQTPHYLCRSDMAHDDVTYYKQFTGSYMTREISGDEVLVLDRLGKLSTYNSEKQTFEDARFRLHPDEHVVNVGGTPNLFWTAGDRGITVYDWNMDGGTRRVGKGKRVFPGNIVFCNSSPQGDALYFVDGEGKLYVQEMNTGRQTYVMDIHTDISSRGDPSAVVRNGNTWFVAFKTNGVLEYSLKNGSVTGKKDLGIRSGVFDMIQDRFQQILWVASDGQGLYAYWKDAYSVRSFEYRDLCPSVGKPVRALLRGEDGRLWVGTKGDGLLAFKPTSDGNYTLDATLTSTNSALSDNSVYSLSPSHHGGFWIGTEYGVNFYSSATRTLQSVSAETDIKYIHSIYEENDSILWLATVGTGVVRARVSKSGSVMRLTDVRRYVIENGDFSSNFFFSLTPASDRGVWAGNRGHGFYKISYNGDSFKSVPLVNGTPQQNDVFAVLEHGGLLWGGTNGGLIGLNWKDGKYFCMDNSKGLPYRMVHALLAEKDKGIWASTNSGLVNVNAKRLVTNYYSMDNGLSVYEFSDGAAFQSGEAMYFGGVNGWVEVRRNDDFVPQLSFIPRVMFHSLQTADRVVSLYAETQKSDIADYCIQLESNETSFTLDFMVMDYFNSYNYIYLYKIGSSGNNGQWIDNGHFNRLTLTQLPPGSYTIALKCRNLLTGEESTERVLQVYIPAPWYATTLAKVLYFLAFVVIAYFLIRHFLRLYRQRQLTVIQEMKQKHQEEVYEEKLNFFTNVTHEFCTPLTLIYNPCERILAHPGTNDFVKKYVYLIKRNAERLNALIQEIIEFRRLDTNHQEITVRRLDVSMAFWDVYMSFADLAEHNDIQMKSEVEEGLIWTTDLRCFSRILGNLLSNAVKYTPASGTICVTLRQNDDKLELRVHNTGKGFREEDRKRIFNRYSVLADVEDNARKGLYTHNGLGLAICHSMVDLLHGQISLNSVPNEYAEFIVELPQLPLSEAAGDESLQDDLGIKPSYALGTEVDDQKLALTVAEEQTAVVDNRPTILAVDDNEEILFVLQESLGDYRVVKAGSAKKALEILKKNTVDLIITDVMMPDTDGLELIRIIKQDKYNRQIPLVILSAKIGEDEKTQGMMTGADAYITKPFSVRYLQATVARLIEKKREMKDYYSSAVSSYEVVDSQLLNEQDRDFITQLKDYIQQNMSDEEWDVGEMAAALGMSTRSMYRKFKDLNLPSPHDYVKEMKIAQAAILLRTTSKTIKEIIFETGFSNRGHFYKEFSKRYNMPPGEYREMLKNT